MDEDLWWIKVLKTARWKGRDGEGISFPAGPSRKVSNWIRTVKKYN